MFLCALKLSFQSDSKDFIVTINKFQNLPSSDEVAQQDK